MKHPENILDSVFLSYQEALKYPHLCGNKAYRLAQLQQKGILIPSGFIISSAIQDIYIHSDEFRSSLERQLKNISGHNNQFAVRSSGCFEDSALSSFAGQLESFLNVPVEQVVQAVLNVRESTGSERIIAYCDQKGIDVSGIKVAVLIQAMIPADVSGIAFGINPVTGKWHEYVISATTGTAQDLVQGRSSGSTYEWKYEPSGALVSAKNITGILDIYEQKNVLGLLLKCNKFYSYPQDIEFAIISNQLFLIQCRPITLTEDTGAWGEFEGIYDCSNIGESYHGVTTPLTFTFARHAYSGVYLQFCRMLKVPDRVLQKNSDIFTRMIGYARGRMYYNMINWHRVLSLLPGYKWNRGFMEQMMGVRQSTACTTDTSSKEMPFYARLSDFFSMSCSALCLLLNVITLKRKIRSFIKRVDEAVAHDVIPLSELSPQELYKKLLELQRQLLQKWDAPLLNDFFTMISFGLLKLYCHKKSLDINLLLSSQGDMVSTAPVKALEELSKLVPVQMYNLLAEGNSNDILAELIKYSKFEQEFNEYLNNFGDRCLDELKLESLTLFEDPLPLFRTLVKIIQIGSAKHRPVMTENIKQPPDILGRILLSYCRWFVCNRENLRFERTRVFGYARKLFQQLGHRLTNLGILDNHSDIFFLELGELFGLFEGTLTCESLKDLSHVRKSSFLKWQQDQTTPRRFKAKVPLVYNFPAEASELAYSADVNFLVGQACSPGIRSGRVRVIMNPRDNMLQAGEIIVAQRTDPGWIVLFSIAGGIIVENGSPLSHAAIVARELGIPAIIGLENACQIFRDGETITIDGSKGTVARTTQVLEQNVVNL